MCYDIMNIISYFPFMATELFPILIIKEKMLCHYHPNALLKIQWTNNSVTMRKYKKVMEKSWQNMSCQR